MCQKAKGRLKPALLRSEVGNDVRRGSTMNRRLIPSPRASGERAKGEGLPPLLILILILILIPNC